MTKQKFLGRTGLLLGWLAVALSTNCGPGATPPLSPTVTVPLPTTVIEIPLATGEWAPYTSETLAGYGAFTEIVSATFQAMGVQPKFVFYPWKRAEAEVQAGRVFAAFPYIETEARKLEYDFSDPVFISRGKFFYLPERQPAALAYEQLEDLQAYRIGGVLGYWYEAPFKQAGLQVDYTGTDEQAIEKLYLGRVDLVASEELVGWALIQKLYPQEAARFATLEQPLNEDPLRLLISRQYPGAAALTQRFNVALQTIRDEGQVQQILQKYGLK